MISEIGKRDSRRTAMKMRGITGKWKHMWHSSPPTVEVAEVVHHVGRPLVGLARAAPVPG